MDQTELKIFIIKTFKRWVNYYLKSYKIGDNEIYNYEKSKLEGQECLNAYITSEADIKVKFGGFLELEIFKKFGCIDDLCVHSEMKVYGDTRTVADLTVHQISSERLWFNDKKITESCRAVIEIKYYISESRQPKRMKESIIEDIKKISMLNHRILRFMMIIDEANRAENDFTENVNMIARNANITLLSNNKLFAP